ncbi:cytochrome d ubiquinol oxidase subunit II [Nakamurella lactea]|uniref:cytochrome d ubiquinol oxidase subunit II n=1 Tax=Nakamurella lactea TaxID=459515 RepID=UPI0004211CA7|nr:cytochrome d ubiquinol oxidase subunit II [Nakamurella lactea]
MTLNDLWFLLIAVLWAGYFVLEGFDFGVGILLRPVGRDERGRRVLLNTIGPVWDGNEVWVITAAGATFAAFPQWYATLFSGGYLPLLLILVCLIVRGLAFEYRGKGSTAQWRRNWDIAITVCSFVPALLWGVVFGSIVHGVPLRADHEFVGTVGDFLSPFALLVGLLTLSLFVFHGAVFLSLKTTDEVRARARRIATGAGVFATVAYLVAVIWMQQIRGGVSGLQFGATSLVVGLAGGVAVAVALVLTRVGRDGWAFVSSAVGVLALVGSIFTVLFPLVMPSTGDPAGTLDIHNAASSPYTLTVMSWVALALVPFVIGYQAWSYWVFRKRISTRQIPLPRSGAHAERQPAGEVVPEARSGVVPGARSGVVPGARSGVVPGPGSGVVPGARGGVVPGPVDRETP